MARDYDVIVIGAGAAGLAAALGASLSGASVLVMEADKQVGGSSRLSGGHFYAAGTSLQKAAGIEGDTADAMYEHYMTLNQWLVEPSVVRRYCDLSAPTFEWLKDLGVEFTPEGVYRSGVSSAPRGHRPEGAGERIVEVLYGHCGNRNVDFVFNSRVTGLLTDDAGRVCGIQSGDDVATAGAVIIATGGFGANKELLSRHYPQAAKADNWSWYIGTPMAQGDGLTLGQQLDICGSYLTLMQVRMGSRLNYEINALAEHRELEFPPLMLISLVENAIKHGLEKKRGDGNIVITVDKPAANRLRVSVSDDGVGLKAGLGGGLGLENIREQLANRFGNQAALTITAGPEAGTIATIELPASDGKA